MGTKTRNERILGHKAYGSIPHLPGSRKGPKDIGLGDGQAEIATKRPRDRKDLVIVQEKLDGSNVAIAKHDGKIIALGRSGYLAETSPYEMHHKFAQWVRAYEGKWQLMLDEGERLSGEWMIQAHGTKYLLPHEPLVAFDLFTSHTTRLIYHDFLLRVLPFHVVIPRLIHIGQPISVDKVMSVLEPSGHGALESVEGAVWRVEREGRVDFLCKYVRQDKVDGKYLNGTPVWNELTT